MFLSDNKDQMLKLLETLGEPITSKEKQRIICGSLLCHYSPSMLSEVIEKHREGWQGNIGAGCRIISRILQIL